LAVINEVSRYQFTMTDVSERSFQVWNTARVVRVEQVSKAVLDWVGDVVVDLGDTWYDEAGRKDGLANGFYVWLQEVCEISSRDEGGMNVLSSGYRDLGRELVVLQRFLRSF